MVRESYESRFCCELFLGGVREGVLGEVVAVLFLQVSDGMEVGE